MHRFELNYVSYGYYALIISHNPFHSLSCPHAGHWHLLFFRKKVNKKLSAAPFALTLLLRQLRQYRKGQGRF